jgi:peptide/nickel transport system substrate-binding protein
VTPVIERRAARFLASLLIGTGLVASAGAAALAQGNPETQTLVILENYDVTTMDPAIAYDPPSEQVTSLAYQTLLTLKGSSTQLAPGLAVHWSDSQGGKVWTFQLRRGVRFADGTPFTSAAVKFSIERLVKMNQGPAWMFDVVKSIATPSPYTVVITLKYPYQPFAAALAQPAGGEMVSPPGVQQHGNAWFHDHTDGTGPYQAQEWIHGQEVVMTRNPYYWQGWKGNHFQRVILKIVTEPSTQQMLLESGQADINDAFPLSTVTQVEGRPGIHVLMEPGLNILYISLNDKVGPTKNVLVRRALAYALDYTGAVKQIYSGFAQQARGPLPPALWGYDPNLFQYHQDLALARQLLKEAGYPHGFSMLITCEENPLYQQVVESFQSSLAQIGVKAHLEFMPWATEYQKLVSLKTAPNAFITSWYADFADPDDFLYPQFDSTQQGSVGFNLAWYANPKVDQLLSEARVDPVHAQRVALYRQVQQLLVAQSPVIWVLDQKTAVVERTNVHGFVYNPLWEVNAYSMWKS